MSEERLEVVQVRMKEEYLSQLDRFMATVKASNRSEAVRRSIQLTDILVNAIINGEKVILERKNGKQAQIIIPGLNSSIHY